MVSFIDEFRGEYGVEPICAVLPIAPSTYHEHKVREVDPSRLPARAQRDEKLRVEIQKIWDDNFCVYGARKIWQHFVHEDRDDAVARCTVERLMQAMGLQGAVRGRKVKTTVADESATRPTDLVQRDFTASRPNELWVAPCSLLAQLGSVGPR